MNTPNKGAGIPCLIHRIIKLITKRITRSKLRVTHPLGVNRVVRCGGVA